jgi:Tfp pilus assembly protein PilX
MAMPRRRPRRRAERGAALVVTLVALLVLGGLLATYLAVSALEPQISRNLADASRARHLAEAGVERGFNVLIGTADVAGGWSGLLAGATNARPWVSVAGLANVTLTGTANAGTFSVSVRNDNGASDTPITGLTGSTQPRMDTSPTADDNATVIMRSTGTFNRVSKTVEVVVQRATLPPFAGALSIPATTLRAAVAAAGVDIDGRDYGCAGGGPTCDTESSWTVTSQPLKYGVSVGPDAQAAIESALAPPSVGDGVKGKSRTDPAGSYTTGLETVTSDGALTPSRVDEFVRLVASNPATAVLHSTAACPLVVTGASGATSTPTLGNGCGMRTTVDLGSRQDPRLVFVRGDLTLDRGVKGAGILLVQDGDLTSRGDLEWDGVVIVAGRGAALSLSSGGRTTIRGAAVASESVVGGTVDVAIGGSSGGLSVRASAQNLDMAQGLRALHSIVNWREI